MVEQAPSSEPGVQKRRSTRIVQTIPLTVGGVDALGQAFKERTSTLVISCHGCKYQSKHYVLKDSWLTVEIPHKEPGQEAHRVRAKVMWIQKPKTIKELFQVAVELEIPGNVWGIAFPPEDWFPFPEEGLPEIPAPARAPAAVAPPPAPSAPRPVAAPPPPARVAPPLAPPAEEKSQAVARPAEARAPTLAGQMERLLAEAKQQIQQMIRETAAATAAGEMDRLARELSTQMQSAAEKAVEAATRATTDQTIFRAVQKIEEARRAGVAAMREEWSGVVEHNLEEATQQLAARVKDSADVWSASFRARLDAELARAAQQAEQLSGRASEASGALHAQLAEVQERLSKLRGEFDAAFDAARAAALSQRREMEESAGKLKREVSAKLDAAQADWRARLESDMAVAGTGWNTLLDDAVQRGTVRLAEQLDEVRREAADQAEQELQARAAAFGQSIEQAVKSTEHSFTTLRETLARELEKASAGLTEIEKGVARVKECEAQAQTINRNAAAELERRSGEMVAARAGELQQRAETVGAEALARFRPALEQTAREFLEKLARQAEQELAPQLARASEASAKLAAGQQAAEQSFAAGQQGVERSLAASQQALEQSLAAHRERVHQASEEQARTAAAQMAEVSAQLQKEFAEATRAAMAKWSAELDEKGTDVTHTTFEALLKASEWYQKKAQTAMQTLLDKLVEEAGSRLREQAGETSRLFASELDHSSRSFAEHTHGLLEEAAREVAERSLNQLAEFRDTHVASFDDEAHRLAQGALAKLQGAAERAMTEMTGQIQGRVAEARTRAESHAEQAVQEFQRRMKERVEEGIAAARQQMDSSLHAVLEVWDAERETQHQEWRSRQAHETNAALENLRERLEMASNAWMAASITNLHAHATQSINDLSRATEERVRETFAQAIAGLADSVRERMLNLSAEILPPKKPQP